MWWFQLGIFGVIGAAVGYFLFSVPNANTGKNALGSEPVATSTAAGIGALVIGFLGWFIYFLIVG